MKQNKFIILAVVLLLGAFALAAVLYQSSQTKQQTEVVSQNTSALIRDHSPRKGDEQAKVTIVEFLDPACGTCKQFVSIVEEILEHHQGKVNLVVRYAPLHPGSDEMIKILDAAHKQGQFWDVLHLMFDTQEAWAIDHHAQPDIFWSYLQQYGFDVDALRAYVNSPEANKVMAQEVTDGQALGATKTPTFFVNGKPMPSFGEAELRGLVESEVAANYPN